MNRFGLTLCLFGLAIHASAQTPAKRPMTVNDLQSIQRVSEPQISPDGRWVAYTVGTPDLTANRVRTEVRRRA